MARPIFGDYDEYIDAVEARQVDRVRAALERSWARQEGPCGGDDEEEDERDMDGEEEDEVE